MLLRYVPSVITLVIVCSVSLISSSALAYTEGVVGDVTIEGVVTFAGTPPAPPPPGLFAFEKFANSEYCSKTDNDGKGNRVVTKVVVNDGKLQDLVVYIRDILTGKPFEFHGTDVTMSGCRFLVQGGPSTRVGVVVRGAEIRILNDDADPNDPKSVTGVLHNPHSFEVAGMFQSVTGVFNVPLFTKGQVVTRPVALKKKNTTFMVQCDQHLYARAFFYPVENPYYAIVGSDGTYAIDRVPKGTYEIVAWHPNLGMKAKTVEVGDSGNVTVNFGFSYPEQF